MMCVGCVVQDCEEAEATAGGNEAAAVSQEKAAAVGKEEAATDASETELSRSARKPSRSFGRQRGSRAMQEAEDDAAAVSEEAAAASDAPAAMDASEAESDSGTPKPGRAFSRGRSSRAVQKPEEEALPVLSQPKRSILRMMQKVSRLMRACCLASGLCILVWCGVFG